MSGLYDAVHGAIANGARSDGGNCRRVWAKRPALSAGDGQAVLQLSRELVERDGVWSQRQGTKQQRILKAMDRAFETGQMYVTMDRLAKYLNGGEAVTADDIAETCDQIGTYRLQGRVILQNI